MITKTSLRSFNYESIAPV